MSLVHHYNVHLQHFACERETMAIIPYTHLCVEGGGL